MYQTVKQICGHLDVVVANAGRGALQIDAEIIAALDEGTLKGATLDVFPSEPLAVASPLDPTALEIAATLVLDELHATCAVRFCVDASV